jgi:hypothetical protein
VNKFDLSGESEMSLAKFDLAGLALVVLMTVYSAVLLVALCVAATPIGCIGIAAGIGLATSFLSSVVLRRYEKNDFQKLKRVGFDSLLGLLLRGAGEVFAQSMGYIFRGLGFSIASMNEFITKLRGLFSFTVPPLIKVDLWWRQKSSAKK